jgi:hypothetical protein
VKWSLLERGDLTRRSRLYGAADEAVTRSAIPSEPRSSGKLTVGEEKLT